MSDDALPDRDDFDRPPQPTSKSSPAAKRSFAERCMILALGLPWLWNQRPAFLKSFRQARESAVNIVVLTLAMLLVVVSWRATFENLIVVNPISIPKSLEGEGYTSTVASQRLIDEIHLVGDQSGSTRQRANVGSESQFAALSTVQVPAAGFSFRSLIAALRDLIGVDDSTVSGEILIRRVPTESYVMIVRIEGPAGRFVRPVEAGTADEVISKAARVVVEHIDPYIYSNYLYETGQREQAEEMAIRLAASNDKNTAKWAFVLLGFLREEEQRFDDSIKLFEKAIDLDPLFALAHANVAAVLTLQGKFESAIERAKAALAINSKQPHAHVAWGDALRKLNRPDEAIEKYREASKHDQKFWRAYLAWAEVLREKDEHDEAIAKLLVVIALKPHNPRALYFCGDSYMTKKQWELASRYLREATKFSKSWGASRRLGDALKELKDYRGAADSYRRAVAVAGKHSGPFRRSYADMLTRIREFDAAIEQLRQLGLETDTSYDDVMQVVAMYRDRGAVP